MTFQKPITKENPYKICFVCFGNICRSPTAEGIFKHLLKKRNLQDYFIIDSAGISSRHLGETTNINSQQMAKKHRIELSSKARLFEASEFEDFDLILVMDYKNFDSLQKMDLKGRYSGKIYLIREFDSQPGTKAVPDPYLRNIDVFKEVFDILYRSCENLLDKLENQIVMDKV